MPLLLSRENLRVIHAHAERSYPNECCGLLMGYLTEDGRAVIDVWVTENSWTAEVADNLADGLPSSKTHRYWIAPAEMLAAMKDARQRDLEIIGIYHSHPNHVAVPSECDRRLAWAQYSYAIVSVMQGRAVDTQSWVLDENHQFQPEAMQVMEYPRMRRKSLIQKS